MSETADLFMPEAGADMPLPGAGKWTVEKTRSKEGYRGISIKDEKGRYVANIVFQLEEDEMKIARRIVDAVNAQFAAQTPKDTG